MGKELEICQKEINSFKKIYEIMENLKNQLQKDLETFDYSDSDKDLVREWVESSISYVVNQNNIVNKAIKRIEKLKEISESNLPFKDMIRKLKETFDITDNDISRILGCSLHRKGSILEEWINGNIEPHDRMKPLIIQCVQDELLKTLRLEK